MYLFFYHVLTWTIKFYWIIVSYNFRGPFLRAAILLDSVIIRGKQVSYFFIFVLGPTARGLIDQNSKKDKSSLTVWFGIRNVRNFPARRDVLHIRFRSSLGQRDSNRPSTMAQSSEGQTCSARAKVSEINNDNNVKNPAIAEENQGVSLLSKRIETTVRQRAGQHGNLKEVLNHH